MPSDLPAQLVIVAIIAMPFVINIIEHYKGFDDEE